MVRKMAILAQGLVEAEQLRATREDGGSRMGRGAGVEAGGGAGWWDSDHPTVRRMRLGFVCGIVIFFVS